MSNFLSRRFWEERDVELYIGKLLRYGVILSSIITITGGIIYISQHPDQQLNFKTFVGAPNYLRELTTLLPAVIKFDGMAIIQLGVAVLIATPILRIAFSIVAFAIEKDRMYIVITCIVLAIIVSNMIFGLEG
ncbi:Uncharacterized membrane protein [Apibacter mensalis]|uniref:Uncharacterized membrane protein n=1 Tax=Apibacter mensalis TaxID=1586267 RepID=A0A0X3ALP7_9FLAO|nr:DUF1634 domain-containing protein [Apibacter mensalis]CVK15244.1 Uncharacterized membrane protein [Apibacter mensalis]